MVDSKILNYKITKYAKPYGDIGRTKRRVPEVSNKAITVHQESTYLRMSISIKNTNNKASGLPFHLAGIIFRILRLNHVLRTLPLLLATLEIHGCRITFE